MGSPARIETPLVLFPAGARREIPVGHAAEIPVGGVVEGEEIPAGHAAEIPMGLTRIPVGGVTAVPICMFGCSGRFRLHGRHEASDIYLSKIYVYIYLSS